MDLSLQNKFFFFLLSCERLKFKSDTLWHIVRIRIRWNRKTTCKHCLGVFDVFYKEKSFTDSLRIHFESEIVCALSTLHNCYVLCLLDFKK